jgi:hypothetical protein
VHCSKLAAWMSMAHVGARLQFSKLPENAKNDGEFGDKLMSRLDLEPEVFNSAEVH